MRRAAFQSKSFQLRLNRTNDSAVDVTVGEGYIPIVNEVGEQLELNALALITCNRLVRHKGHRSEVVSHHIFLWYIEGSYGSAKPSIVQVDELDSHFDRVARLRSEEIAGNEIDSSAGLKGIR